VTVTRRTFRLPDLGEGLADGEVLAWLVDVGDVVEVNQPLCEVETAKAAVELPSPYAGRVAELHVRAGETLDVGAPLVSVEETVVAGAEGTPPQTGAPPAAGPAAEAGADSVPGRVPVTAAADPDADREPVLVGYGPRPTARTRRPRRPLDGATAPAAPRPPVAAIRLPRRDGHDTATSTGTGTGRRIALAAPPVRKRAKDLGVDLTAVRGSGPGGIVTRDDLEAAARGRSGGPGPTARSRRVPVTGVRRASAAAMVASAFTAPHATVFLVVDMTASLEAGARLARRRELEGLSVGPLLLVAKALLTSVRRHPDINARWDEAAREIEVFDSVNLGVAAATPRGLLVPNIEGADRLSFPDLARALTELTATARAGRTTPERLRGGTITITNVGVFGVDAGTPILNPGEAAILAVGAVKPSPWVCDGEVCVRSVAHLALSFDHRLVDGELASRVLADVGALLEDPALALAWC
jgi:2-oxoisovalerate dehydrogenase E2 component (dihydrolipoyl transacylase)